MLEAIRGAQESINFEAFLFHSGEVASQFRDALAERARAGVRVRVSWTAWAQVANLTTAT